MRITKIELNDFRAFAHPEEFDLEAGKNVLLFGANGAGKSSLFRALREIFNYSSSDSFATQKNLFTDPARTDGYVRLHFSKPASAGSVNDPVVWAFGGSRARLTTPPGLIRNQPKTDERIEQGALRLGTLAIVRFSTRTALLEVVPQDPAWPRILVLDDVLIGLASINGFENARDVVHKTKPNRLVNGTGRSEK